MQLVLNGFESREEIEQFLSKNKIETKSPLVKQREDVYVTTVGEYPYPDCLKKKNS